MCSESRKLLRRLVKWIAMFLTLWPVFAWAGEAAHVAFVSGKAEIDGKTVELNAAVQEGANIKTGADGYVYLKTIDDGFLILRPNSDARIVNYHVDQKEPTNTRIKLELINGVARSISGKAVKLARQNFRFNTPVAAIGVRGTDFTVFTTQETTRIAVISGGVIVSGFNSGCAPQGLGPCEGAATAELFARQQGQLLQVNKGQTKPQLLNGGNLAPDSVYPPRPDEPGKANVSSNAALPIGGALSASEINLDPNKSGGLQQALNPGNGNAINANSIIWGRWKDVLGQSANVDLQKRQQDDGLSLKINNYFAIYQSKDSVWQVPTSGSMGFALKGSQVAVFDPASRALTAAKLENAKLQLDFAKATFTTGFDLVLGAERFALQGQGNVFSNGTFEGVNKYTLPVNMSVDGIVTAEKGGAAAYIFQSRLENNGRLASGVTYWGKQ